MVRGCVEWTAFAAIAVEGQLSRDFGLRDCRTRLAQDIIAGASLARGFGCDQRSEE